MFILTAILVLGFATMSYAQTPVSVTATAIVVQELRLTAQVYQIDSKSTETYTDDTWAAAPTATMSFGNLTHIVKNAAGVDVEAGLLYSKPYYYIAILGGFTSGRKYKLQSSCIGLSGTGGTLTKGFGVTNIDGDPKQADGTTPINAKLLSATTGSLGALGSATVLNKTLYDSGVGGESRVIYAYYGIPPYASGATTLPGDLQPIPVDTTGGTYSGTVTFSLTLY